MQTDQPIKKRIGGDDCQNESWIPFDPSAVEVTERLQPPFAYRRIKWSKHRFENITL
jgi:hypothetical protein